jgi:hypothetical protein
MRSSRRALAAAVVPVIALVAAAASTAGSAGSADATAQPLTSRSAVSAQAAKPCTIFPADNIWKAKVTKLPVDKRSAAYVKSIGSTKKLHADFGSGTYEGAPFGMPITTVKAGTAKVHVKFHYSSQSDKGPYPLTPKARIEGGSKSTGDRHVILLDTSACKAYELYDAHRSGTNTWSAGSGAVFNLRSDKLRPKGWTSADAAGLAILPGLVRYSEIQKGKINHAIRITVPTTRDTYVWPARHEASSSTSLKLPPMGQRFRLKASIDISKLPKQARIVAQALKTYGAIVADNGSSWYLGGTQDSRWSNDALHALGTLPGSDFQAVDVSSLEISSSSGATR